MKKILFTLFTIGILFSCNDDDSNTKTELIGNWKLIEVVNDIGDGKGIFSSVESDKIITFKNDGKLTSNGDLCTPSIDSNNQSSGTYSKSESSFNSSDCSFTFEKNEDILIIHYLCRESCSAKYMKE